MGTIFDPAALEARVADLERDMQEPGFWDDQERAARVSADHSRITGRLSDHRGLEVEVGELSELAALAREEERAGTLEDDFLAELADSLDRVEEHLLRLEEDRLFRGEHDGGGAVVSIHAGEGGTDAQDWTEMLLRMYLRWAERRGLAAAINEATEGTEAGLKSVTFTLTGTNAYGLMSAERGVHRLVRLSPFDAAHRRQTSFAAVQVSPVVDGDVDVEIDEKDLRVDTYRSSGAGGQHVNKTESAIRITHLPTKIVVQCQNERSQMQNRATAMSLLRSKLLELEIERREEEAARARGESRTIGFGSQIRSYVLQPYTMVKDLRTQHETGNVQAVLDGDIDAFIRAELERRARDGADIGTG
ncbi:MAG: peptide chain release factor 2 [Actinomycetota bacterium]